LIRHILIIVCFTYFLPTKNFGQSLDELDNKFLYDIPANVGMNDKILKRIDNLVEDAIQQKAMPGCQILIARNSKIIFEKAYGYQTYDSIVPVNQHTIYDLASLTKVLATTSGIMFLLENDSIDLDQPLSFYLEYLKGTNKEEMTIREVLAHQAGLYPYFPFWKKTKDIFPLIDSASENTIRIGEKSWINTSVKDSLIQWAAYSDLVEDRFDTLSYDQYIYSDVGFYFLKDLIELRSGERFDEFVSIRLFKPLQTGLAFQPLEQYKAHDIAPTELDTQFRNELIRGYVHDHNAILMGGVAGQAGLFGNAKDVAKILQMYLNEGSYHNQQYFKAETIQAFNHRYFDHNRRGLGWDKPGSDENGPVSKLASDETFGHTGFTGPSVWADPKENLIFVFLSNRIYPSAENTKLIDMNTRTRIQDLVYNSIIRD
jgi:CubicO group peptidase (beta-lactamase class C family)